MNRKLLMIIAMFFVAMSSKADQSRYEVKTASGIFEVTLDFTQRRLVIRKNNIDYQIIYLETALNAESKIVIRDFNLDGIDDIGVTGDEGNVERFMNVYIYSKSNSKFELSKSLSAIPCLTVNVKNKNVSGECFHVSSCENWREVYSIKMRDSLRLIEKSGYYCDPSTNTSYRYIEKYRNGKLVKSSVAEVRQ